jgi:hypothetical protein
MTTFEALRAPFRPDELEWRVQSSGINDKGEWAMVLAYVTNRAIQDRLDNVVGPANWKNEYVAGPDGGVMCGLSILHSYTDDDGKVLAAQWITKWDGAPNTDIESVKGGLSDAMKRAAVQWGIGRYLYGLDVGWASFKQNGKYTCKIDGHYYKWDPPKLPDWALPAEEVPKDPKRMQEGVSAILALLEDNEALFTDSYIEHMRLNTESVATETDVENLYRSVKADVKKHREEELKNE